MLIFLTAIILHIARCERRCKTDGECADLGDLICIKTSCDVGLCGCKRGYASRFVGHEFKCVKIKRIGEECSSGSDGTCGAGSCVDGKCTCIGGVAHLGGTYCSSGDIEAGETRSGELDTCPAGSSMDAPWTCTCPTGQKVVISYAQAYSIPFTGGKVPICGDIQVGEFCIDDADCSRISSPAGGGLWATGAAVCTNNVCQCPGSNVADITGLYCAPGLGVGTACTPLNPAGVCTGSDGLTCGDVCDTRAPTECICDAGWKGGNSGPCTKKAVGDVCFGDSNCKSINDLAVCVDGYCEESSAAVITISFILSLATFVMHFVV